MKNFHFMLIAVCGLGLFSTVSVAEILRETVFIPLPGVDDDGELFCEEGTGVGSARIKFSTRTGRGIARLRGTSVNFSGRTQRYRTNALLDSCVGDVVADFVEDFGFGVDLDDIDARARLRVSRRGRASGVAVVRVDTSIFDEE